MLSEREASEDDRVSIEQQQQNINPILNSNLDFNLLVINPNWRESNPSFLRKNDNTRYIETPDGEVFINVKDLITNLDFFTRDIRLSNYDRDDMKNVRWYIEYAGVMAQNKYFDAFNFCLLQVANYSETSQGRQGFLRKIINTLTTENVQKVLEPPKKNWITGKQKQEE